MADVNERMISAIFKILTLTRNGTIKWRESKGKRDSIGPFSGLIGPENVYVAYEAVHLRRTLVLEKRIPNVSSSIFSSIYNSYSSSEQLREVAEKNSVISLRIVDKEGKTVENFPSAPALKHLWTEVSAQEVDVPGFLDDLLGEEEDLNNEDSKDL